MIRGTFTYRQQESRPTRRPGVYSKPMQIIRLETYMEEQFEERHINANTPFTMTLQATATNTQFQIYFPKGLDDLTEWMDMNFGEDMDYVKVNVDGWVVSIFDVVRVNWGLYQGGCSRDKDNVTRWFIGGKTWLVFSPKSGTNNCALVCLRKYRQLIIKDVAIRQQFKIKAGELVSWDTLVQIAQMYWNITPELLDGDTVFDDSKLILHYHNNHYSLVIGEEVFEEETEPITKPNEKKQGILFYDLETRPFEDQLQRESIIYAVYRPANKKKWESISFTSFYTETGWVFAGQQFLQWLSDKAFVCYAHNGSRFDLYFLLSHVESDLLIDSKGKLALVLRGLCILQFTYYQNEFKDSCAFLTNSLDNLCKSFNTEHKKISDGTELCFYKRELGFKEFMDLAESEPEFWAKYCEYCEYDVLALRDVVMKFNDVLTGLIGEMSIASGKSKEYLAKKGCSFKNSLTIGGLAKKLFLETADQDTIQQIESFIDNNKEKMEFISKFVRGGISYLQYPGKHDESIALYDIKSMYPAAMIYMKTPVGQSKFVEANDAVVAWSQSLPGFYMIENIKFDSAKLRPVAKYGFETLPRLSSSSSTLCWKVDEMKTLYVDSYMLRYLHKLGLESFDIVKALVSESDISTEKLFATYVGVLYAKKQEQDDLPKEDRNNALRETIKLFLNALSGKLVENPLRHKKFVSLVAESDMTFVNGIPFSIGPREDINSLCILGLEIYSYSKRLLWEYIRLLPNQENDVIASETDSIYVYDKHRALFESNVSRYRNPEFTCVAIGDKLGNFAFEESSVSPSYFLGKKIYYFGSHVPKMKCKGVRPIFIAEDGTMTKVLDEKVYDKLMIDGSVTLDQSNLKKVLNSRYKNTRIHIDGFQNTKRIRASYEYTHHK